MKKQFNVIVTTLFVTLVLSIVSCKNDDFFKQYRKKDRDKDKGKPTESCITRVSTVDVDLNSFHFWVNDGFYANKKFRASNYKDYANKIVSGRSYKIGYRLIPVTCMTSQGDIVDIEITCLTEVEKDNSCDCKSAPILDDPDFDLHSSHAQSKAYIQDDKLYVSGHFISTDIQYAPNYELFIDENFQSNIYPLHMLAKLDVKETTKDTSRSVDLKGFDKNYCFDLTSVKEKYNKTMQPGIVTLHIELKLLDGTTEVLKYTVNN